MAEGGIAANVRTNARRKRELRAQRRGLRTSVTLRCTRFEDEYQREDRQVDLLIQTYNFLHERLVALREVDDQLLDLWEDEELDVEVDGSMQYQQRADDVLVLYRTLRAPSTRDVPRAVREESPHSSSRSGSRSSPHLETLERVGDDKPLTLQKIGVTRPVPSSRSQSTTGSHTSSAIHRPTPTPRSSLRIGGDTQIANSAKTVPVSHKQVRVKLPKLELKLFDGDLFNWQPFADHFSASVIENTSLSDVDRLLYLKSSCTGAAYHAIAEVCATNANFQVAWDLLQRQFGRKRTLVQAHIEAIQHLKPLGELSQIVAFRQLYSDIQQHLSGLERLETSTEAMSAMLVPCILRTLPLKFAVQCERDQTSADTTSVRILMDTIRDELEAYEQVVKSRELNTSFKPNFEHEKKLTEFRRNTTASSLATTSKRFGKLSPCVFCNRTHCHAECSQVTTPQERWNVLRRESRCFSCLNTGHMSNQCPQKFRICVRCKGKHHVALCDVKTSGVDVKFTSAFDGSRVLLQTLSLQVEGKRSKVRVRVILDPGSQVSFIENSLAKSIGAQQCGDGLLRIDPFGSRGVVKRYAGYSVRLLRLDGKPVLDVFTVGVPTICSTQRTLNDVRCLNRLRELGHEAADQPLKKDDQIRVLIGSDYYWRVVTGRIERINDELTLIETAFGWVANGRYETARLVGLSAVVSLVDVHFCLEKFWALEHVGIKIEDESDNTNNEVLQEFEKTIERSKDGRYIVRLPWNERVNSLKSNELGATVQLRKLLWRLERDNKLCHQYRDAMTEYVNSGFVESVNETNTLDTPLYYLPHHAVVKEERTTTKVRVVFDASAHEAQSPSLNECLHTGPSLLPDLAALLIRFRLYRIAFIGNIAKAFLQISLHEIDRDAVRLFWVDDRYWTDQNGGDRLGRHKIALRKTVVLFGAGPSPFLLNATIKHHIRNYVEQYPMATNLLNSNLYVDDLFAGADTVEQAFELSQQCKLILQDAQMPMRKWDSSSAELLSLWKGANEEIADKDLLFDDNIGKVKVLGVRWHRKADEFTFDWVDVVESSWTKQKMLSRMAQIYDPLGFVAPYVVTVKILMQTIWKSGLGWDETVDDSLDKIWRTWLHERALLSDVRITRWIGVTQQNKQLLSLHVFCDASTVAYGAVVFVKIKRVEGTKVYLLMAKSRVAPLKVITIPRLELLAVLLGARLIRFCVKSMTTFVINDIFGWSDSEIALCWIRQNVITGGPFVAHRVQEIQSIWKGLAGHPWKHVSGLDNPADVLSRRTTLTRLLQTSSWWNGPQWLMLDEACWPVGECETKESTWSICKQSQSEECITVSVARICEEIEPFEATRYSSFWRLLRVMAWVLRWRCHVDTVELNCDEIKRAEIWWVRFLQRTSFSKELLDLTHGRRVSEQSQLTRFDPFLLDGIIRVGGRLSFADIAYEQKHPIILPSNGHVLELLIRWYHAKCYHVGVVETLNQLRLTYWVLRGRRTVAWALRKCLSCSKFRSKPFNHPEAPLPAFRAVNSRAFAYTGVDFAGPLWVKENDQVRKTYIVLFTCATCRAVHLELSYRMDATSFILALRRFVARHGVPVEMWSDNARTFGQVSQELRGLRATLGGPEVQQWSASVGFRWKFIVERAAWWGGWWERMVGLVKGRLRRSLGRSQMGFEELQTVLLEIAVVINSRPLTTLAEGQVESPPLTPNHFVMAGQSLFVPESRMSWLAGSSADLRRRWGRRLHLVECFWRKWKSEYLMGLRSFHELKNPSASGLTTKVGDVVMLRTEKTNRCEWPLGRVTEV